MLRATKCGRIAIVAGLIAAASPALAETRIGVFQTTDRKMDYLAELCGAGETQLCVTLTAVRDTADIPRTREFLGRYVVDHAKPSGTNRWKGEMTVQGYTVNGTIALNPGQSLVLSGCALVVVCEDFTLIPER